MLIALGYRKGVGKDTTGSYLMSAYAPFTRFSIASRLKMGCARIYNLPDWIFDDQQLKDQACDHHKAYTPRQLLQQTADSLCKSFGEDVFVKSLNLEQQIQDYQNIVITDMRKVEEAAYLKSLGFKLVRVDRDTGFIDQHKTEHALDEFHEWDYVLQNNGTEEMLERRIDVMMTTKFGWETQIDQQQ